MYIYSRNIFSLLTVIILRHCSLTIVGVLIDLHVVYNIGSVCTPMPTTLTATSVVTFPCCLEILGLLQVNTGNGCVRFLVVASTTSWSPSPLGCWTKAEVLSFEFTAPPPALLLMRCRSSSCDIHSSSSDDSCPCGTLDELVSKLSKHLCWVVTWSSSNCSLWFLLGCKKNYPWVRVGP